jgi:flavin-dependent dehydrogenase
MLLGDAAGLVDPLTREGIYYALLSGRKCAEAILRDTGRAGAIYEEELRQEVYPELARAAALTSGFFAPRFSQLLIDALRRHEGVRQVFVDLIAGRQPYRGLPLRLLRTGDWRSIAGLARLSVIRSA